MDQTEAVSDSPKIPNIQQESSIGTELGVASWIFLFIVVELAWTFVGGYATWIGMDILPGTIGRLVAMHINFAVLLGAVGIVSRMALRSSLLGISTDSPHFRWRSVVLVMLFWFALQAVASGLYHIWAPGSIHRSTAEFPQWLAASAAMLVLTPLQCAAEELLMRAFLWRMLLRFELPALARNSIAAGVFMLAHVANPEVSASLEGILALVFYGLTGFLFMEMTSASGGIEVALGAHIGNNLFIALVVNYIGSSLPAPAWFIRTSTNAGFDILVLCVSSACVLAWLRTRSKKQINGYDTHPCR